MRKPKTPPAAEDIWRKAMESGRLEAIFGLSLDIQEGGKYLHWHKLQYHEPPGDLTREEWWLAVKIHRRTLYKPVLLTDTYGNSFQYLLPDPIPERLHRVDLEGGGHIQMPEQITNPETKDRYYVNSLIEEAITSSQLEGAATTRQVAKEIVRTGRPPRDRSERMILNNYRTMQRIGKWKDEPLTKKLVFEIHRLVTEGTLDDPSAAGRPRRDDESVRVEDSYGEVFHIPPPAGDLERRMEEMCDFANGKTPDDFIHPVIRSIILHFWLSYDHPFVDGNGRTARAMFYWSMLRHGYWLFEFISISRIILNAPAKYGRAFLYTETDENDLTYFILYHLDVIWRAIRELHKYIQRKTEQLQEVERELRAVAVLNHRQRALIAHALRHPGHRYTMESHRMSHNVVHQTARKDLLDLRDRGLLHGEKVGKTWRFMPVEDIQARLAGLP